MVQRDGARKMHHHDDHILPSDEAFRYQGNLPLELAKKFEDEKRPRITLLQGFIACGKTRTSKEFVRLLARNFREQKGRPNEVHTFLFDLRHKSVESLLKDICREFKDKVKRWGSYGNVENVSELIDAFGKEKDCGRVFIIILNKVDRAQDKEQAQILELVRKLVSDTGNVYMVLTSRTDVTFVRDGTNVMKHPMKPMKPVDAKELLKETSGNPKSLDEYADKIIDLVGRSPLALMIAGHEMNGRNTQLPYTPRELVGVMTDSTSLSLDLENVPAEDSIISMVAEIVKDNFHVLEKIIVALDCPQLFDTEDLEASLAAVSGPSLYEGQIKQTILRVVLGRSLYGLNREGDSGVSFESSPLLIKVLKETFCQLTSKDGFLKQFNENLVNTLNDTSPLMRSGAKELRQAEIHLLRNQKGPKVTPPEVQDLRMNVITKAAVFLDTLEVNAMTCREFQTNSMQILKEWERAEAPRETIRVGIQETCSGQREQPVTACENLPRTLHKNKEKELEACVSPTALPEIVLPCLKDTNQAVATAKTTTTEAGKDSTSEETKKALGTNSEKEDNGDLKHTGSEKNNANEVVSSSISSPNPQEQEVIPELTCINKTAGKEVSKSDVHLNDDENVSQSHVTSNVFTNESEVDLCKSFNKSVSLDASFSMFSSLHSNDCRKPAQETQDTYSVLTTLPVSQVLPDTSNLENRKAESEMSPKEVSLKEAVESEFDWENGDNDEEGESTEVANVGKKFGVVTHTEGKNDHLGEKTNHEVKKPHLQPEVETSITTATTTAAIITTTSETQTSHPSRQHSHPKDWRNKTRGQGILGSAPSSSSSTTSNSTSSSFHFPAHAQGPRLPSHNNPMPYQNTSFTPVVRGYGLYGHPHIQQQGQMMLPGPFPPHPVQGGSYNPPYNGDSIPYNQFEREYNGAHQESLYNLSNDILSRQFSKDSDKFSQARGPPTHSNISTPTVSFGPRGPSYRYPPTSLQNGDSAPQACALPLQINGSSPSPSFRPQGPSYRNPHTHWHPHHVSNSPSSFQPQATPNRFPQACGPPSQTCVSSPSPSFRPQGPSYRFSQAYGPSQQNYVSSPQPGWEMQSSSDRFSQAHEPPLQNSGSSLSASFQPQGPPSWNVPSPPQSLSTNGFYVPPGNRNGPPSQFNERNYDHHQYGQNRQQPRYGHQRYY